MTNAWLLIFALAAAPAPEKFDAKKPDTWRLSAKLPPKSALREAVVAEWTAKATQVGEAALTRDEAEALLNDPRAELVYADKTINIVAPSMSTRQRKGHQDLLQVFLKPERLEAAEKFAGEQRELLEKARAQHHVDPEVVVSILMWESKLGTITGDFVAFNSFTSQAFFIDEANDAALTDKAERAQLVAEKQKERVETIRARARRNLAVLVRTCKARGMDALSVKGSWAGALGFPQFMPATLRWAEDGDGDGKIDLFTFADSIASIARYLEACDYRKSRQKAVWAYNHEQAYVDGVLAFADALKARREKSDGGTAADGGRAADGGSATDGGAADGGTPPASLVRAAADGGQARDGGAPGVKR
jgi:membrane-bound lytic murein transglycosylase B